ncbi:MAG: nucleoside recognition protein [Desulfobacteraceae bacterium]|nr:MAG: nucleoside recognition protein [Desulfobacteraceae bacterium]
MKRVPLPALVLLISLFALLLMAAVFRDRTPTFLLDPDTLFNRVIRPLLRLSLFISIGLFAALIVEGAGWTNRLAVIARPFMRWGHLSSQIGSAFTTSFFSGISSLAMLASFFREGKIGRKELILAVLLDTFPSYFLHLPATFFIILPLVGKAGIVFLLITFFAALLRFGAVLVYTHFHLPAQNSTFMAKNPERKRRDVLFMGALNRISTRLFRILLIVAPVYMIMLLISDLGFFEWVRNSLALGIGQTLFPVEGISVVILSLLAEATSGYAAAGAMMESGTLTMTQTVLALIAGQIIGAPLRALRHQLPYYMGIFSPGMGITLIAASQSFRVLSLMVSAALFLLIA